MNTEYEYLVYITKTDRSIKFLWMYKKFVKIDCYLNFWDNVLILLMLDMFGTSAPNTILGV